MIASVRILLASGSLVAMAMASPALAQVEHFDLAAQPAQTGIPEFGRQAHLQILVAAKAIQDQKTSAVRGELDVHDALGQLIQGTTLKVASDDGRVVSLLPRSANDGGGGLQPIKLQSEVISQRASAPAGQVAAPVAGDTLGELVVTATRQASTVNHVALSISAVTQAGLDQRGIKSVADLSRLVPSLTISSSVGGASNFTIRGVGSQIGAATTGVYLDDTALTKRNATGANTTSNANGAPTPLLFDLDRIEVLRGPQGTLYGGSSEGGTIRFITPTPSLTRYSAYIRSEVSFTEHGDPNYETGVALGGPIVTDKLGFRASVYGVHTGGYIDHVDPYNGGAVRFKNSNSSDQASFRGALRWQITDRATASATYYDGSQDYADQNVYNLPIAGTFTTAPRCFNGSTNAVACTAPHTFQQTSATYGPFPYLNKPFNTTGPLLQPASTRLQVASASLDYDFGGVDAKFISSYLKDSTSSLLVNVEGPTGIVAAAQTTTAYPSSTGYAMFAPLSDHFTSQFLGANSRHGVTEELRLSSPAGQALSWVGGL